MRRPSLGFVITLAVIILAFITFLVLPIDYGATVKKARIAAGRIEIRNLSIALDRYQMENDAYPTTEQGLKALLEKPTIPPIPKNWEGPYLTGKPIDPWKNPYQYRCPSIHPPNQFDLWSFGLDRKDGTEDDITNWSPYPEIYTVHHKRISDYAGIIIVGVIITALLALLIVLRKSRTQGKS